MEEKYYEKATNEHFVGLVHGIDHVANDGHSRYGKRPAYGIFGDGGYYMWSLAGLALAPVTVETYPSARSVQINFPIPQVRCSMLKTRGTTG